MSLAQERRHRVRVAGPDLVAHRVAGRATVLTELRRRIGTLVADAWPIACSDGIGKLLNLGLLAVVARRFGAGGMGVLALCESFLMYGVALSDMGAKMIGIRLAARHGDDLPAVIPLIQRKREMLSLAAFGVVALWSAATVHAANGEVWTLLLFTFAVVPYAASIDWAPWGSRQYRWLAAWRVTVAATYVLGALGFVVLGGASLLGVAGARVASYAAGLAVLWMWRSRYVGPAPAPPAHRVSPFVNDVRWSSVLILGAAAAANQIFQTIDVVMLATFRTTGEVGIYAAAYKLLFVLFSLFYLITQTYLPSFSRRDADAPGERMRSVLAPSLLLAVVLGAGAAIGLHTARTLLIRAIYGPQLAGATGVLAALSFAVPLDFVSAVLGIYIIARGYYRDSLFTFALAALTNVCLNWFAIPRYGPMGAAVTTSLSYLVLIAAQVAVLVNRSRPAVPPRASVDAEV